MNVRLVVLAAIGLATVAGEAAAVAVRGVGRPAFLVELTVLPGPADSADVEITWEVPLRDLAFQPEDDVFRARYEIAVVLSGDGKQAAAELWERRVRARTIAETRDPQKASRGRRTIRLPYGRFDVRVSTTDRISGARSEGIARLDVRAEAAEIGLSDLRLVRYTVGGVERNTSSAIPLGEAGHYVRATLRAKENLEGTVTLRWRMIAPGGVSLATQDTTVALGKANQHVDLRLQTGELLPGAHEVEVRLGTTGRAERRQLRFQARLRREWFESHRERTLEILHLLDESDDVKALEESAEASWPDSLRVFWERRDPTPGTAPNEFVEQLQERVEAACTLFVEPFRHPGWKTDRGRSWVRWGPPTRRTANASEVDRPATEVWEYEAPRRVLVFVDRGSGEYWLSG